MVFGVATLSLTSHYRDLSSGSQSDPIRTSSKAPPTCPIRVTSGSSQALCQTGGLKPLVDKPIDEVTVGDTCHSIN